MLTGLIGLASIASFGLSAPAFASHTGLDGNLFIDFDPRLIRPSGVIEAQLLGLTCGGGLLGGYQSPCGYGYGYGAAPAVYSAPVAAPVVYSAPIIQSAPIFTTACASGCLTTVLPFADCY